MDFELLFAKLDTTTVYICRIHVGYILMAMTHMEKDASVPMCIPLVRIEYS